MTHQAGACSSNDNPITVKIHCNASWPNQQPYPKPETAHKDSTSLAIACSCLWITTIANMHWLPNQNDALMINVSMQHTAHQSKAYINICEGSISLSG